MQMVGVPEATLTLWVGRFLGRGFKVARVDEAESMLAKEMREKKVRSFGLELSLFMGRSLWYKCSCLVRIA